jgi:hypothetical protein
VRANSALPVDVIVYPPTSDGDRAALIATLAAILVRIAQDRATAATSVHETAA